MTNDTQYPTSFCQSAVSDHELMAKLFRKINRKKCKWKPEDSPVIKGIIIDLEQNVFIP